MVKALSTALTVLGIIAVMQISGSPAVIGQIVVFISGVVIIGAYTRRYMKRIEITARANSIIQV